MTLGMLHNGGMAVHAPRGAAVTVGKADADGETGKTVQRGVGLRQRVLRRSPLQHPRARGHAC